LCGAATRSERSPRDSERHHNLERFRNETKQKEKKPPSKVKRKRLALWQKGAARKTLFGGGRSSGALRDFFQHFFRALRHLIAHFVEALFADVDDLASLVGREALPNIVSEVEHDPEKEEAKKCAHGVP
jgi:hypothetical protein